MLRSIPSQAYDMEVQIRFQWPVFFFKRECSANQTLIVIDDWKMAVFTVSVGGVFIVVSLQFPAWESTIHDSALSRKGIDSNVLVAQGLL